MKSEFLGQDFFINSISAQRLYHEYAKDCPIIDYHSHLPADDIADDRRFSNLTEIWLDGDHYKWRAMRANGISEQYITGAADSKEKFDAWARTVPYTVRNPLYHWTHLELRRYFGINELLNADTADSVYNRSNEMLNSANNSTRALLRKMKVEVVCTSDDPLDDLTAHKKIRNDSFETKVLPTWRPDELLKVKNGADYNDYVDRLESVSNISINNIESLFEAIEIRHNFFHDNGCRLADHGMENFLSSDFTWSEMKTIFNKIRSRLNLNKDETITFQSGMIHILSKMNYDAGWAQQYHVGAIRNTNPRALIDIGPNTGFDSIGSPQRAEDMAKFFGRLSFENKLAPSILYNNNPADNYLFASMVGNYQDGRLPGKMQHGAAWWFLDQKEGIKMHLNALSNLGLLSRFVGMVTDSRSFLSFPRHEYFRRILCNILGREMEEGLIPNEIEIIGSMVKDICYNNAKRYFGF